MIVSWVYICVQTYQIIHFLNVEFIFWQLCLNKAIYNYSNTKTISTSSQQCMLTCQSDTVKPKINSGQRISDSCQYQGSNATALRACNCKIKLYCKILFCTATTVWVREGFSQLFSFNNFHFHFIVNLQLKIFITFLDPRSMASQPQQPAATT